MTGLPRNLPTSERPTDPGVLMPQGGSRRPASILAAACYILQQEKPDQELGGHYIMHRENTERATRSIVRKLERRVAQEPAPQAR